MIYWYEPTREQKDEWRAVLQKLPTPELQRLGELYPPWKLYKTIGGKNLDDIEVPGGLHVFVGAVAADGRLRIVATQGLNVQITEDMTFRVFPDEIALCEASDLPTAEVANAGA